MSSDPTPGTPDSAVSAIASGPATWSAAGYSRATVTLSDPRCDLVARHVGLTRGDLEVLRDHAADVLVAEPILDKVFTHVLSFPMLGEIVTTHSSGERLGGMLVKHLVGLWSGRYDDASVRQAGVIGRRHDHINLPMSAYLGAIGVLDDWMLERLLAVYPGEPARVHRIFIAWRHVIGVDSAIVCQTFIDARDRSVDLLEQVVGITEVVGQQQRELESMAADLAAVAQTSGGTSADLAGYADAMNTRVAEAVDNTHQTTAVVEHGQAAIFDASAQVTALTDLVQKVRERGAEVEQQLTSVAGLVGAIERIADQTNLLALNAAIEAARAGDAGRGFAVVADEVRKLAAGTRESLDAITEVSSGATSAVGGMRETLDGALASAATTQQSVDAITGTFEGVHAAFVQSTTALDEMRTGSGQVLDASRLLAGLTEQIGCSAEQLTEAAQAMARNIEESASLVSGTSSGTSSGTTRDRQLHVIA